MSVFGEVSALLGLISSVIAIFETVQEIYDAARDVSGLPKKFRAAAEQIPLIYHTLARAEENIRSQHIGKQALQSAQPVLQRCKENADRIKEIFDNTIPSPGSSRLEQMRKAVGLKMKSNKLKENIEEVLKGIELLIQSQILQDAQTLEDIQSSIAALEKPDNEEEEPRFVHFGSGHINANTGSGKQQNNSHSGSGSLYIGETLNFAREPAVTVTQIDEIIQQTYENGRLRVKRLSGDLFSLDRCFVNLSIVRHVHDSAARLGGNKHDQDSADKNVSRFSITARLKVESPPTSDQISLDALFEPREQKDGRYSRPKRVLIWGRAGMGKTTLCKKIVYDFYNKGLWRNYYNRIIWLPLRRLRLTRCRNVEELLEDEFPCHWLGERTAEAFHNIVQDQSTLFLLDGLDEVSLALAADGASERILHNLLSRFHVIITSRPHATRLLSSNPPGVELETVGFLPEQVEEYLQQVVKENSIEEIRSFIQEHPIVQGLARIPIQLDAICYTWSRRNFPRDNVTMTTLYSKISQNLWKNSVLRLEKRYNGEPITERLLEQWLWQDYENLIKSEIFLLQELGFRGLCEGVVEFSIEDVASLEASRLVPSSECVHLLFLRISDSSVQVDERTFHFIHLTFQEFFAAQYFVSYWVSDRHLLIRKKTVNGRLSDQSVQSAQYITPEEFVRLEKYTDRYNIFWRFVIGLLNSRQDEGHLIRLLHVINSEPLDLIGLQHQRLVVHCLSELGTTGGQIRHQVRKLEDHYVQWAHYQSKLLGKWGYMHWPNSLIWETECSDYVLAQLLDETDTEQEVLRALHSRSSISCEMLNRVTQKLTVSTIEAVRTTAVQIIGRHCGFSRRERVFELFDNTRYQRLTSQGIVRAWSEDNQLAEPAIEALVGMLQNTDEDIEDTAVTALHKQTNLPNTAAEALVRLLQDLDQGVQQRAAAALEGHDNLPITAVETLIGLLQGPNANMRHIAARALQAQAELPDKALRVLVKLLHSPDKSVWYQAAVALGGHAYLPAPAIEALIRLLQEPEKKIRAQVVDTLMRQVSLPRIAVEPLIGLLQDEDEDVQSEVTLALGKEPSLPITAVTKLIKLLQAEDHFIRSNVASTLGTQARLPTMAIEALIELLGDDDSDVRHEAALALGTQTSPSIAVIEVLIERLQDPDPDIQYEAAVALGEQNNRPAIAIDALIGLLQDEDVELLTRLQAVFALGNQNGLSTVAVTAIVQLLQNSNNDVRVDVVRALREQCNLPDIAIEALISLLQDKNRFIRDDAASALIKQANLPSSAIKAFVGLLHDSNQPISMQIMEAVTEHSDLRPLLLKLDTQGLHRFRRYWFKEDFVLCFIEKSAFYIKTSGDFEEIEEDKQLLEAFRIRWHRVTKRLKIPGVCPVGTHA